MSERRLGKHETFHRVTKHELLKTKEGRDYLRESRKASQIGCCTVLCVLAVWLKD